MSISITASRGLQAAQRQLDAAASAIARQPLADAPSGAGAPALRGDAPAPGLVRAMTDARAATYAFQANLKALRTQDALLGTLLDVRA
ncbi:MAG: hypothetical protein ACK40R_04825 [Thermomonas sp.]